MLLWFIFSQLLRLSHSLPYENHPLYFGNLCLNFVIFSCEKFEGSNAMTSRKCPKTFGFGIIHQFFDYSHNTFEIKSISRMDLSAILHFILRGKVHTQYQKTKKIFTTSE